MLTVINLARHRRQPIVRAGRSPQRRGRVASQTVDQGSAPLGPTREVEKLLNSAIANAEQNPGVIADNLMVDRAWVDEGPTLRRFRPRAYGRATRVRKRTSHVTVVLKTMGEEA